jgi:hypothetical protein
MPGDAYRDELAQLRTQVGKDTGATASGRTPPRTQVGLPAVDPSRVGAADEVIYGAAR